MDELAQLVAGPGDRLHDAWLAHHERLWRSLFAWSGDQDVASEALAESFAQALRRGDAVDDVGRWVWRAAFRIAAGLLADGAGRAGRAGGAGGAGRSDARVERADGATLPDDAVALIDALDRLRPDDRRMVVLSVVGGWSASEIGRLVDAAPGTVRVRLHRAKVRLRTILEEDDG